MTDLILKEAKDLLKEKESDVTWLKIFEFFEKLVRVTNNQETANSTLLAVSDLLIRSLQSDRSRLNGISLVFLKKCVEILQQEFCFNQFLPILIKLTGKSNKIFVSRAMDTLCTLCKHVELKCLLKNIQDFAENPNKNIRVSIFKLIEIRIDDAPDIFKPFLEKGIRDPAQEVRSVCKPMCALKENKAVIPEKEIKKTVFASLTPRKAPKLDSACAEIKKLEDAIKQIAKEEVVKKKIDSNFFEKLNKLKKERKFEFENRNDDLTPRRLDKYLEKYRSAASTEIPAGLATKPNIENTKTEPYKYPPGYNDTLQASDVVLPIQVPAENTSLKVDGQEEPRPIENEKRGDDLTVISIENSDVFKTEVDAIEPQNDSVLHFIPDNNASFMILKSDDHLDKTIEIIEDYECGLHTAPPLVDESAISDLNRSFANISIEPSKMDSFQVMEEGKVLNGIGFNQSYSTEQVNFNNQTESTNIAMDPSESNGFNINTDFQYNSSNSPVIALIENYETNDHMLNTAPINSIPNSHEQDSTHSMHNLSNSSEANIENVSIEQMRSIELLEQENHPSHFQNTVIHQQNIAVSQINTEKQKFAIENIDIDLEILCSDLNINFDNGLANDDISSFIEKLSGHQKNDPNGTFYMKNDNNTIIIDSVHTKEPSNIFHPESNLKASCIDLFNEPIFCSDDESFSRKTPLLKEKPTFSIEITSDICNDEQYAP